MVVTFGLLADAANLTQNGKLNVLGVFNKLLAGQFPAVHPAMVMVLRFACNSAEYGQEKKLEIVYRNADGKPLITMNADMKIPDTPEPEAYFDQLFGVNALPLPYEGDYDFVVMIGGETKATIPLRAELIPAEASDDSKTGDN